MNERERERERAESFKVRRCAVFQGAMQIYTVFQIAPSRSSKVSNNQGHLELFAASKGCNDIMIHNDFGDFCIVFYLLCRLLLFL